MLFDPHEPKESLPARCQRISPGLVGAAGLCMAWDESGGLMPSMQGGTF